MKKNINVMIDIETLGVKENAYVFQIAAKLFSLDKEEEILPFEFEGACPVIEKGPGVEKETLEFWKNHQDVLDDIQAATTYKNMAEMIKGFESFLKTINSVESAVVKYWGNGPSFDNVILRDKLEDKSSLPFWNDACVRTIKHLAELKLGKNIVLSDYAPNHDSSKDHNAMSDVNKQIQLVQFAHDVLIKNINPNQESKKSEVTGSLSRHKSSSQKTSKPVHQLKKWLGKKK